MSRGPCQQGDTDLIVYRSTQVAIHELDTAAVVDDELS